MKIFIPLQIWLFRRKFLYFLKLFCSSKKNSEMLNLSICWGFSTTRDYRSVFFCFYFFFCGTKRWEIICWGSKILRIKNTVYFRFPEKFISFVRIFCDGKLKIPLGPTMSEAMLPKTVFLKIVEFLYFMKMDGW